MSDRHLYKAKRTDNGEWVEGYYVFYPLVEKEQQHTIRDTNKNPNKLYFIDPSTICQCTGLKDKNGKIIWENDILMCHGNKDDLVKAVFGKFFVVDVETLERIDEVIGWHYEVIPTDALSKCEPFNIPMPLTDYYIQRCEAEVIGSTIDNSRLLETQNE